MTRALIGGRALRALSAALWIAACGAVLPGQGLAQQAGETREQPVQERLVQEGPGAAGGSQTAAGPAAPSVAQVSDVDYAAWEEVAARAEATLADPLATSAMFDFSRAQLVTWRESLLVAQKIGRASWRERV